MGKRWSAFCCMGFDLLWIICFAHEVLLSYRWWNGSFVGATRRIQHVQVGLLGVHCMPVYITLICDGITDNVMIILLYCENHVDAIKPTIYILVYALTTKGMFGRNVWHAFTAYFFQIHLTWFGYLLILKYCTYLK